MLTPCEAPQRARTETCWFILLGILLLYGMMSSYLYYLVIFFAFVLCQANYMHLWCNTMCWPFPCWCQWDPYPRVGRKAGEVWGCTFILDAKLTMVRCFSLFCWTVLSSGRLSLLAAPSHPPQKSKQKTQLGFLYETSSPTPHTKFTTESLSWLCTYSLGKYSTNTSCLLWMTMGFQRKASVSTHKLSFLKSQAWMPKMVWQVF